MGRFINADAFTSTGQSVLGNNMFAYCVNNPANLKDSTGFIPSGITNPNAMCYRSGAYMGWIIPEKQRKKEAQEKQAHKLSNTDEEAVLDADHYAFYKGALYIKVPGDKAFSCGVVFFGHDIHDVELVKHEYGHTQQLNDLGIIADTVTVMVPSILVFWSTEMELISRNLHHSWPWEYKADEYGNANYWHTSWAEGVSWIYWSISEAISRCTLY